MGQLHSDGTRMAFEGAYDNVPGTTAASTTTRATHTAAVPLMKDALEPLYQTTARGQQVQDAIEQQREKGVGEYDRRGRRGESAH